jgi:hypothetical protein
VTTGISWVAPTWDNVIGLLNAVLVWPVAAVFLVWILRDPLKNLLGRIRSYEGMGQKLSFGEDLADAEISVERATRDLPEEHRDVRLTGDLDLPPGILGLIDSNPSSALMLTWSRFAKRVQRTVEDHVPTDTGSRYKSFYEQARLLRDVGRVNSDWVEGADSVRHLRNAVAHGQHVPTSGEALAYVETVHNLNLRLDYDMTDGHPGVNLG